MHRTFGDALKLISVLFISIIFCTPVKADTATTTFQVTSTVISSCGVSASDLAFGDYDIVAGTAIAGSTTVSVTCSSGTAYEIGLDAGLGAGATVTTRKMTNGGNTLSYSLYSDVSHTTVWGETTGVDTLSSSGTGAAQNFTVYGLINASQSVPTGSYSDTITVTVTF
ncbi:Csu type fimbrial protein [Emcibacter nanhaiensis]|uniref:Spore coat U domain-containing protein n=1 Tax=Emcibacter nanhaiensis TaxID=1505037 RepID=A0A501PDD5_9PROT|nr:spore coat U domain-containing protein [Emcibacter nanhaiensis]TPD57914.1 spore coat U domain-containing protein [Emcibacter nanhaiensis]